MHVSFPRIEELPYHADSAAVFEALLQRPWPVFLDSGRPGGGGGRFDILSADPYATLTTRGALTRVSAADGAACTTEDPLEVLREWLAPRVQAVPGLPFAGGAIGYFGYDLARRFERLPAVAADDAQLPEMALGIYDWALLVDHARRRSFLVGQGRSPLTVRRWPVLRRLLSQPSAGGPCDPFRVAGVAQANLDARAYARAFQRIKHYIREGDCYQVNLAQRFSVPGAGEPWTAYRALRRRNPAPYAAFLRTPEVCVLSASPERFLSVTGGVVETRPIKGTRARSADPRRDRHLAAALLASAKDRAENLMIVDLLRNDLGKTCTAGSVRVPRLFELQSFATVHHLVSTVTGRLAPGRDALDLLRGCFPGGSITGAPKLRAMQIIEELEPHRRGVYCGAIGYLGFDGNMDSNIAIRTLTVAGGTARFWAGGGIVWDSDCEAEYQETFDKAAAFLRLLESLRDRPPELSRVGG